MLVRVLWTLLAGGVGPRLSSSRRRGGGAAGLILPAFVGERTASINLPNVEEPPPGMVRLVTRPLKGNDGKTRYSNHVVFNRFDMDDPEQLEAQSGPDNDDSYRGTLGRDKDGPCLGLRTALTRLCPAAVPCIEYIPMMLDGLLVKRNAHHGAQGGLPNQRADSSRNGRLL